MSTFFGETISFHWNPNPEVIAAALDAMALRLDVMTIPLERSRDIYIEGIEIAFDTETAPGGGKWAPWSEEYAFYAQNINSGILDRTGALRGAVTSPSAYLVTGRAVFYTGAGLPGYGGFHMSGTSKMPARPFIGMSEETESHILAEWVAWFDESTVW